MRQKIARTPKIRLQNKEPVRRGKGGVHQEGGKEEMRERGEREGIFLKSEVVFLAAIGCFLKPPC